MSDSPLAPGRQRLLTAAEVAEWLQVSISWVHQHANGARRPHLPSVKLGKSVRFLEPDVETFLKECRRLWDQHGMAA